MLNIRTVRRVANLPYDRGGTAGFIMFSSDTIGGVDAGGDKGAACC